MCKSIVVREFFVSALMCGQQWFCCCCGWRLPKKFTQSTRRRITCVSFRPYFYLFLLPKNEQFRLKYQMRSASVQGNRDILHWSSLICVDCTATDRKRWTRAEHALALPDRWMCRLCDLKRYILLTLISFENVNSLCIGIVAWKWLRAVFVRGRFMSIYRTHDDSFILGNLFVHFPLFFFCRYPRNYGGNSEANIISYLCSLLRLLSSHIFGCKHLYVSTYMMCMDII